MNKLTQQVYQKHLTLEDRSKIEDYLKEDYLLKEIADSIHKDNSTISKEIRKNRTRKEGTPISFNNYCSKNQNCTITRLCNNNCRQKCKTCNLCTKICKEFEERLWDRLKRFPYVCNGCEKNRNCRKIRYVYHFKEAHSKYLNTLKSSREGINISQEKFEELDNLITKLTKQGQSISLIYANHKDEIPCKVSCLYNYVETRVLSVKSIDLPRKVRYKIRKKSKSIKKDPAIKEGRSYEDFKIFLEANPDASIVELDTVEGKKGGKVLLTLIFRKFNFMIAILLPDKTSASVINIFNKLEAELGYDTFKRLFNYILTDNGSEFLRPVELETSITAIQKRCNIYYCNPNSSFEKGCIEKNHEYIRYIIPKGTTMDNYTQDEIDLMMSHINSVARELLNFATPYDMAKVYLGSDILKILNIVKIEPDNIILKPYLLKQVAKKTN